MIARDAEKTIKTLLSGFPVVTITGPRQSGKTTLAKAIFPDKPYVSLEDPDVRFSAKDDPRSFLERFPQGGILDEIQRCPELLSYLQTRVDASGEMGLFLLTGSQQFGLMSQVSQSLAGRTAFLELLPFSIQELTNAGELPGDADHLMLKGSYPPVYDRNLTVNTWYQSYVMTYVERDVRQILKVQELETFQIFLRLCAGRAACQLNYSSLGTECGITHNTAKAWISVLSSSYLVFLLRPHHANFKKRLVKMPKLYFYDTGLLCWLLGIRTEEQLLTHPLRGHIFENMVVSELLKSCMNQGERSNLFYWRDQSGNEVDVIVEMGTKLRPIEIKSGKTLSSDSFSGLNKWMLLAKDRGDNPTLIYGGEENYRQQGTQVCGWRECGN